VRDTARNLGDDVFAAAPPGRRQAINRPWSLITKLTRLPSVRPSVRSSLISRSVISFVVTSRGGRLRKSILHKFGKAESGGGG